jgi:pyocin large subunit-like protein
MSFHVSSICSKRKLGGSSRKQVLVFLADKASDDGSGIWCSKATIALETELSRSTVKRLLKEFEADGLTTATGRRKNTHGYTVEYAINLNAISTLPPLREQPEVTEVNMNPVQNEPSKQLHVNRQDSSACTPNHPTTSFARAQDGGRGNS